MPLDQVFMEIAAARLLARRSLEALESCTTLPERDRLILTSVRALQAVSSMVLKASLITGDAPLLRELWQSIAAALPPPPARPPSDPT
jgi:hypothetical protein